MKTYKKESEYLGGWETRDSSRIQLTAEESQRIQEYLDSKNNHKDIYKENSLDFSFEDFILEEASYNKKFDKDLKEIDQSLKENNDLTGVEKLFKKIDKEYKQSYMEKLNNK